MKRFSAASFTTVAACALMLCTSAFAQREQLKVGDTAPGLDIEAWVKGEETSIESGNVYVVEFWATWCVPCRQSIPHLSELQHKYEPDGLTIIGVSNEEEDTVRPFVRRNNATMEYTVAVDSKNSTSRSWMQAARLSGIPAAFIVDRKGKIQWIGHPLDDEFESTLEKVLEGRYDAVLEEDTKELRAQIKRSRDIRNWRMALKYYDDLVAVEPYIFAPEALEKYEMLLVDMNDPVQARAWGDQVLENYANDPGMLDMFARKITIDPVIPDDKRDMELAMTAAENALSVASGDERPKAEAVLALVHFHQGNVQKALQLQKRAYMTAMPQRKKGFRRVLRNYQEAAQKGASSGISR